MVLLPIFGKYNWNTRCLSGHEVFLFCVWLLYDLMLKWIVSKAEMKGKIFQSLVNIIKFICLCPCPCILCCDLWYLFSIVFGLCSLSNAFPIIHIFKYLFFCFVIRDNTIAWWFAMILFFVSIKALATFRFGVRFLRFSFPKIQCLRNEKNQKLN